MKFGLLNVDSEAARLAEALVAAGHTLTLVYRPGDSEAALRLLAPEARLIGEWEEALACGADFVYVGSIGEESQRLEQLQRLVQEGMPAAFTHPQTTATLAYFELDMHRQATSVALVPVETIRHEPAIGKLAELGRVVEVIVERRIRTYSRGDVLRCFIRDIGAIRRLVGECEKVSAMGSPGDDGAAGQLGIQITTAGRALVRWSIGVGREDSAHWRVLGEGVSAEITAGREADWPVEITREGRSEKFTFAGGTALQATAAAAAAALADPQKLLWREALADLELVEAVERSLRKGRTVELFHEEASEQGTFHGVMAAGGCLLLILSIFVAVAATMVGKFRFWLADFWPYVLLAVLVLFLLMQFLKLAFPTSDEDSRTKS